MASKLMCMTAVHVFLSWNYASSISADRDGNEHAADVLNGYQRDTIHSSSQLPVAEDNHNEPSTGWGFDHMGNPVLILSPSESPDSANNPSAQYGDRILETDVPNGPSPVDGSRGTKSKCSENASDRLEGTTTVGKTILKKRKNVRRKYQHGPYVVAASSGHSKQSDDEPPNANIDDGMKNNLSIGNVQVPFGVPADNLDASVLSSFMQNDGGPSGLDFKSAKSTKTAKCLDDKLLSALQLNKPFESNIQQAKPTETFEKYDEKLHQFLSRPLIRIPPKMFDATPQPVLPDNFHNGQLPQQALASPFIMHHPIKPMMRPSTVVSPVPPHMMNPETFFHKQSIVENKRPLFEVNKQQEPEDVPYSVQFEPMKLPPAQFIKPACRSTLQKKVLTSALPETVLCDDRPKQPLKLLQWTAQHQNTWENINQKDTKLGNIPRDRYKPNNVLPFAMSSPGRPAYFVAPTPAETSFDKKQPPQPQWIKDVTSPIQNVNAPVIGPLLQPTPIGTNVSERPQYVQPSRPSVAVPLSSTLTGTEVTEPIPQLSPAEEEISIPQLDDQQQQPIINLSSAPQLITTSVVVETKPTDKDASTTRLSNESEKPLHDSSISPDFVAPKPVWIEQDVSVSQPYTSTHSFVTHLPAPPKLTKAVESTSRPVPAEKLYWKPPPYYGRSSRPFVDSPPSNQFITTTRATGSITSRQRQRQRQRAPVRKDVSLSTADTAARYGDEHSKSRAGGDREKYKDARGKYAAIESRPGYGAGAFRPYLGVSGNDRPPTRPFQRPDREVLPVRRVGGGPVALQPPSSSSFSPSTLPAVLPYRPPFYGPTAPVREAFPKDADYAGRRNAAGSAQRVDPSRPAGYDYAAHPSSGLSTNPLPPYPIGYDGYSSPRYSDHYRRDNGRNPNGV